MVFGGKNLGEKIMAISHRGRKTIPLEENLRRAQRQVMHCSGRIEVIFGDITIQVNRRSDIKELAQKAEEAIRLSIKKIDPNGEPINS